jgi:4-amino-4-deoxy-L-arabinose transferase-like glycosyltransferase
VAADIYTLTPLSIFASRSFMPDMVSLSLSIVALYLMARWLERAPDATLFVAACLTPSLAILVKPPAVVIGVLMLVMVWGKYGACGIFRRELAAFAVLSLIGPLAWYTHAYSISVAYVPYHFFGAGGIEIKEVEWCLRLLRRVVRLGLSARGRPRTRLTIVEPSSTVRTSTTPSRSLAATR